MKTRLPPKSYCMSKRFCFITFFTVVGGNTAFVIFSMRDLEGIADIYFQM